jgi:hypothetical protein
MSKYFVRPEDCHATVASGEGVGRMGRSIRVVVCVASLWDFEYQITFGETLGN